MMRPLRVRGRLRIVGALQLPSPLDVAELRARAWWHNLFDTPAYAGAPGPTPPLTLDLAAANPGATATMLGNGTDAACPDVAPVGDCVVAADLHLAAVRSSVAGQPWTPTTEQALAEYSAVTGYVVGRPETDQGTDPLALLAWRRSGAPYPDGSTLLEGLLVDASDERRLRQGIWLPSGAMAWACLPDGWESEGDEGDVWDVAGPPNPDNGHAFALVGYDDCGPIVCSWGELFHMRWAAAAQYLVTSAGGGVLAPLDDDALDRATGLCPAGYDLRSLQAYLEIVGRRP